MSDTYDNIEVLIDTHPQYPDNKIIRLDKAALLIVSAGTAEIEIDFTPYSLKPNRMLLLVPLGNLRQLQCSPDFTASCVFFAPKVAEEITAQLEPTFFSFLKEYPVADLDSDDMVFLGHLMRGIKHVADKSQGEHRIKIMKNMLQCFILELYDRTKEDFAQRKRKSVSSQEYFFMKYLDLVHKHAATEREVKFYADLLCITPRYLQSIVRGQTGRTAKSFIDRHCTQEIKIRLSTTNDSIQAIARQLNFPDHSFFTRYFKKQTGLTPKEFRTKAGAESGAEE